MSKATPRKSRPLTVKTTGRVPLTSLLLAYATHGRGTVAAGIQQCLEQAYTVARTHLAKPVEFINAGIYRPIDELADVFGYQQARRKMLESLKEDGYVQPNDDITSDALVELETACKDAGFFLGLALAFELTATCRGGKE